jgi:hypothetical protein
MLEQWMLAYLIAEGREDTIVILQEVEREDSGLGTIVYDKRGFSGNDEVHNAVLNYLRSKKILVYNPAIEAYKLYRSFERMHNPFEIDGDYTIPGLEDYTPEELLNGYGSV